MIIEHVNPIEWFNRCVIDTKHRPRHQVINPFVIDEPKMSTNMIKQIKFLHFSRTHSSYHVKMAFLHSHGHPQKALYDHLGYNVSKKGSL